MMMGATLELESSVDVGRGGVVEKAGWGVSIKIHTALCCRALPSR